MGGRRFGISDRMYSWWYDHIECHGYDLLIAWFALPFGGERRMRRDLIETIRFEPGERILDLCCGTGGATFVVAERAPRDAQIVGLDLSVGQVRIARKKNRFPNVRFTQGDAADTGFETGSFDKVFIPHALHEMFHDLRMKVLREARRLLRDGGELIVLDLDNPQSLLVRLFAGLWGFYWLPFNFETPTRREMFRLGLANEVAEAGFRSVHKLARHRGVFQVVTAAK